MQSFLSKVTTQVLSKNDNLSNLTFILPSKRASLFLKTEIIKQLQGSVILPKIISVEEFIKEISGVDIIESTSLIFEFYKIYLKYTKKDQIDSFEIFSKWASILLHDFNEIDSNLVDANSILSYINDSKRLEKWNLKNNDHTPLTQSYLAFFENIKTYYTNLYSHLSNKNLGYQGISYRIAFEKTELYIKENSTKKFIITGFNALNKAEESIFHEFLINNLAEIYWDTDSFYFDQNNEAGKFFKLYKSKWSYYTNHNFNWIENNLNTSKNIQIYGVPKNITQIKKVGDILQTLKNKENNLQNTAVILCNENLLPVLLNSIPKEIENANITMGYSLQNIPLAYLFELIFKLHINKAKFNNKDNFYYKDFLAILKHPSLHKVWVNNNEFSLKLNTLIITNKIIFISQNDIKNLINKEPDLKKIFNLLFNKWDKNIETILQYFISIIDFLKNDEALNYLEKEYLFRFNNVFQQLINLNNEFGYIIDLKTLYLFYKQILKIEKLSFQGEPLKGLQIMGMLESRVLDFENIILTSVNEGFLPVVSAQNSFIPFDIKVEKELPTYQEKDAIFAYHFYRLLHRAKNIYILYNTETDDFGSGEQSRFITQLEIAKENKSLEKIIIQKTVVIPKLESNIISLKEIEKSDAIISQLKEIASKGFSPSSLSSYIRNPIDFYKQKILKLKEIEEVEEAIAANTFGTIIHEALYELYNPYIKKFITKDNLLDMKGSLHLIVTKQFKKFYSLNSIKTGKNYLSFEIAKQFLINFLNFEIGELGKNKKIKILALETPLEIKHKIKDLPFPIKLRGNVDRIDEVDGVLRIIDYKTGKVESKNLTIKDWNLLSSDYQYSKSFQVLLYAYMYGEIKNIDFDKNRMQSGIISFKNLKSGFMEVNKTNITQSTFDNFLLQLDKLIIEIYNQKIPFKEKEIITKSF
ncbi:MAG: PD-(D/E)XK nuclease family protein [Flavobacteriaceae bacterium]|nr:PD-(D/E)XK nuclease family protein [Flavobacteriaceae bacterium]